MNEANQSESPYSGEAAWPPYVAGVLIGGAIAGIMLALNTGWAAWVRGFLSELPEPAEAGGTGLLDRGVPLELIRDAIVGRGKSAVAAVFGAPRTAAASRACWARDNFWTADTWYYPIDTQQQTAMAVRFEGGIARGVEFFEAPQTNQQ